MANIRSFNEYISDNYSPINEMAWSSSYKPTNRSVAIIEKEIKEVIDRHNNQDKYEREERTRFIKEWNDKLTPVVNKILPAGCEVNYGIGVPQSEFVPINVTGSRDEICSLHLPAASYNGFNFADYVKASYINHSSGWCHVDSPMAKRLIALGKIVESIGSKKSSFWKEYYDTALAISALHKANEKEITQSGNSYTLSSLANDLRDEFINASFQTLFKNGWSFDVNGFTANADSRGRGGQNVKTIIVEKIKRAKADVRFTYESYSGDLVEDTAAWPIKKIFEAWSSYNAEGEKVDNKYEKISRW